MPPSSLPPLSVLLPRWRVFGVFLVFWSVVAYLLYTPGHGLINWYTSIMWSLPIGVTIVGLIGVLRSAAIVRRHSLDADFVEVVKDPFYVVIPTKGTDDTYGALETVVGTTRLISEYFADWRVEIVVEDTCEAKERIVALAARCPNVSLVLVPSEYVTPNGAKFKARVSQYALDRRIARGETGFRIWTLHMDDDTALGPDLVMEAARFIAANNDLDNPGVKHLAQGILAYDQTRSPCAVARLADSIRPFDDMGRFATTTGSGLPLAGMHGENLLVRTSVEETIGWDFGPNEIVEDSRFALEFTQRFPGRSDWYAARCYGASPVSAKDFVRQRARWAEGMIALALNRTLALKVRLLVLHNMVIWGLGIFQPALVVLGLAVLVGDFNMSPVTPVLNVVWVVNMAYTCWAYWEGLRQNARATGHKRPSWRDRLLVLPGILVFSVLEGWGGTLGVLRHLSGREKKFDGVAKPL